MGVSRKRKIALVGLAAGALAVGACWVFGPGLIIAWADNDPVA
jgi:hypothetical protein